MRPIECGTSPRAQDFDDYRHAFPDLVARIGWYCSYCERRIPTNLAVEHIQPKALPAYAALAGRWDNFLLGCVNCNSTKGKKNVVLADVLLPDRDNTFVAFTYLPDGQVLPASTLAPAVQAKAASTLALCGLDKAPSRVKDANGQFVAIDQYRQRMEVWRTAEDSRDGLTSAPSPQLRTMTVRLAVASGFFSIWMKVFEQDAVTRQLLIQTFQGTAGDCFDAQGAALTPRPANGRSQGGKC